MSKKRHDSNRRIVKQALMRKYGKRCQICGHKFHQKKLQLHHIYKFCNGGETSLENCGLLCDKCHKKLHMAEKYDKNYYKYMNNIIREYKKRKERG